MVQAEKGEDIETKSTGSTSNLLNRKDLNSIRRGRTPSSFTTHSQLVVSRKLFGWKLEKCEDGNVCVRAFGTTWAKQQSVALCVHASLLQQKTEETAQEEQWSHRHVCPSSSTIAPVALPPLLAIIASGLGILTAHANSRLTPRSHTHRRIQAGFKAPVGDQEICTSQMNKKSYTKKYMCHLDRLRRFPREIFGCKNWVQKLLEMVKTPNKPNQRPVTQLLEQGDLFRQNNRPIRVLRKSTNVSYLASKAPMKEQGDLFIIVCQCLLNV